MSRGTISRRQILQGLALGSAASMFGGSLGGCSRPPSPASEGAGEGTREKADRLSPSQRRFLIVVGGIGGASIIDSFMAIRQSETSAAGGDPSTLNTFPDAQVVSVNGTPFRAVDLRGSGLSLPLTPVNTNQAPFVTTHRDDLMVATVETTSVNHTIAQKRSITGNNAWRGRTLQECVAYQYGEGLPLPNANMAAFGFLEQGTDESLPNWCFSQPIANPLFFSLGLDGQRGIKGAPSKAVMALARKTRDEKLDPQSVFYQTFRQSKRIQLWMQQRGASQKQIETLDLVSKLCLLPNIPGTVPLIEYGLETSPDGQTLLSTFPKLLTDPLSAQAALSFLLIKYGVSVSVSLSPTFNVVADPSAGLLTPPLAFDYSHNDHRAAQALMWERTLGVIDKLIGLLKSAEVAPGESFWSRSLVYVATDFGRSKDRQANDVRFGSGHDLNNGVVVVSPKANGNRVLGGVDPKTALTYGFNPSNGAPDPGRRTSEAEIFAGILGALKVDTTGSGLPAVPALYKA
jgi:hypothetical protein